MLELEEREEQEDPAEYCPGGYHPVNVGDIFNGRYQVHCKLGWGYFSTVWLCQDRQKKRFVAVKVSKSGYGFTQTAQDELSLLRCVRGGNRKDLHDQRIVQLFDDFKLIGKNGIHVCMVFELLGHHLRHWMHRCKHQGLPIPCAKRILQQVLQGLHHLHTKCKIIHADVKPENVLLCLSKEDIGQLASNTAVWTPTASQTAKTEGTNSPQVKDWGKVEMEKQVEPHHHQRKRSNIQQEICCYLQQFDASTLNPLDPTNAGKIAVKIADLGSACWVFLFLNVGLEEAILEKEKAQIYNIEIDRYKREKESECVCVASCERKFMTDLSQGNSIWIFAAIFPGRLESQHFLLRMKLLPTSEKKNKCFWKSSISVTSNGYKVYCITSMFFQGELCFLGCDREMFKKFWLFDKTVAFTYLIQEKCTQHLFYSPLKEQASLSVCLFLSSPPPQKDTENLPTAPTSASQSRIVKPADPPDVRNPPQSPLFLLTECGFFFYKYKHFSEEIQTRQYRALEVLLGAGYGTPADIWSTACMAFELVTGEYLFEPRVGTTFSRDEDHVAHIIELLGRIPAEVALSGTYSKKYFNRRGEERFTGRISFLCGSRVCRQMVLSEGGARLPPTPEGERITSMTLLSRLGDPC
uniref:non-specific serine/threonine protein kinase n=1 Tax=Latimeria chalumnae TaxID=7897 RepID=H2ZRJ6_LATCH